jgi:hypothetical protein
MAPPAEHSSVYRVQGRQVGLPVQVRWASSGSATFVVSAAAAQRLLPGDEFAVARILPGRGLCSIAAIDYRDNDLGAYNEVSIALFVRPRGEAAVPYLGTLVDLIRSRLGTYILHLPVDQSFSCEAGRAIWGFPKTVQQIDFTYAPDRMKCELVCGAEHALTLCVPRRGSRVLSERPMTTYTHVEGIAHRTRFVSGCEGFGMSFGTGELALGTGRIADELRSLGLPKRALMTTWMEQMRARFEPPEKL